jgi:nucleolar protein 53
VAGLGNRPAKKLRPAQVQARRQRGQRALQARQGSAGEECGEEGVSNDLWTASVEAEAPASFPPTLETVKGKKRQGKAKVPRTMVDPQGCSYNPTYEAHQDVLAEAVAVEAAKEHKARLSRARWLLEVPPTEAAASGPDRCAGGALGALESDSEEAGGEEGRADPGTGGAAARKKTRADLNKRKRRKESELRALEKERTQRATKQIDNLRAIEKEIDKEEDHLEARRRGRTPKEFPRLGRTKYTPAPIQVLATDEVKGSIRALNSCATVSHVVQDALFRSGAVEPRKPVKIPRKKRFRRA